MTSRERTILGRVAEGTEYEQQMGWYKSVGGGSEAFKQKNQIQLDYTIMPPITRLFYLQISLHFNMSLLHAVISR